MGNKAYAAESCKINAVNSSIKLLATIVTATFIVACASHSKDPHTADTEPVTISSITDNSAGELGVGPTEGGEVMDFLNSLKADIVTA